MAEGAPTAEKRLRIEEHPQQETEVDDVKHKIEKVETEIDEMKLKIEKAEAKIEKVEEAMGKGESYMNMVGEGLMAYLSKLEERFKVLMQDKTVLEERLNGLEERLNGLQQEKNLLLQRQTSQPPREELTWETVVQNVWELEGEPQLDSFVNISGLFLAGLRPQEQDTARLFFRKEAADLWGALQAMERGLKVQGPPGIGKSVVVWVWTCWQAFHQEKSVMWVHLTKEQDHLCVKVSARGFLLLHGGTADVLSALGGAEEDIVVLDGVVSGVQCRHLEYVQQAFKLRAHPKRRAIVVSSLAGKSNAEDDEIYKISTVETYAWTLEQYKRACEDVHFYSSVKDKLFVDAYDREAYAKGTLSKEQLIEAKYFYAGGSARWMFAKEIGVVEADVMRHVRGLRDVQDFLAGSVGELSANSVNHLRTSFLGPQGEPAEFFVSEYVTRLVMRKGGEGAARVGYALAGNNPAFEGWVVEEDFIGQLDRARESLSLKDKRETFISLTATGSIPTFSPERLLQVKVQLESSQWLRPEKWNQTGYDLLRLDNANQTLTFLQVTRGRSHDVRLDTFSDTAKLVQEVMGPEAFLKVDVVMVVPQQLLSAFKLTPGNVIGVRKLCCWQVAYSNSTGEMWERGREHNQVRVLGFRTAGNVQA